MTGIHPQSAYRVYQGDLGSPTDLTTTPRGSRLHGVGGVTVDSRFLRN